MTARLVLVVAVVALVTAPLASSQDDPPRDLWSEFPLEPTQTTQAAPVTAPLTPPTTRLAPAVAVPGAGGLATADETSIRWLWTALIVATGLGTLGFLAIRRRLFDWSTAQTRMALSRSVRTRGLVVSLSSVAEQAGRRARPRELRRFSFGVDPELARLGPCAIHRTGLIRRRFVAEASRADHGERRIGSSRPFWRFGGNGRDAWNGLIDDLKVAGWELVPTWGAQNGEPTGGGEAWYEVQLVRAAHRADLEASITRADSPGDAD